jgi:hypothetical protein
LDSSVNLDASVYLTFPEECNLCGFEFTQLFVSTRAAMQKFEASKGRGANASRVTTYRQIVDTLLNSLSIIFTGHNMSHYASGPRMEASQLRNQKHSDAKATWIEFVAITFLDLA